MSISSLEENLYRHLATGEEVNIVYIRLYPSPEVATLRSDMHSILDNVDLDKKVTP